jgi:hypothetical protein
MRSQCMDEIVQRRNQLVMPNQRNAARRNDQYLDCLCRLTGTNLVAPRITVSTISYRSPVLYSLNRVMFSSNIARRSTT